MIKIMRYSEIRPEEIFCRVEPKLDISAIVREIIEDVRLRGDEALFGYCEKFDHVKLQSLEISRVEMDKGLSCVEDAFLDALNMAAANIRAFHKKQARNSFIIAENEGIILGQKLSPMERVGLYVPGGTAAYPSTVLMDAIPAVIAGCKEVFIATPPGRDGQVNPAIIAAARIAGVEHIYKMGGAQAIAAFAYGTQTIPKVDKIVGPGNAFVAEAKRQVFGKVAIDMIAGPSEILVIADGSSDPERVAADMLSQAEHDKMASAVLVTDDMELAVSVQKAIECQLKTLPRRDIARASIDDNGKIIVSEDITQAIDIANTIAPEHLELCIDNPFDYLDRVKHAGSIFMGRYCPEALGDYLAGPNHTLPTGGTARFSSPLSVDDFIKKSQYIYYTKEALQKVSESIALFARAEGLEGHARSALSRSEEEI